MRKLTTILLLLWLCLTPGWAEQGGVESGGGDTSQGVTIPIEATLKKLRPNKLLPKAGPTLAGGFSPHHIEVEKGERVTIILKSLEGKHSLAIPDYNLTSAEVTTGESTEFTFLADKEGEFKIECASECHGMHVRMTGTLVVRP